MSRAHRRLAATALVERRARLSRARRLSEYARGIVASREASSELRATRLYRRALRTVDPQAAELASDDRLALRDALRERLAAGSLWHWMAMRRRRIGVAAAAACLVFGVLFAKVPALRKQVFPDDLADGKAWVVSSYSGGFAQKGVMNGAAAAEGLFQTDEELYPSVTLDLAATYKLHSVRITNRTDCCVERALPLAVELSTDGIRWTRVGYRRAPFSTWSATFQSTAARYVRLRVDRRSILHLRRIEVY
jgi:hypothetical protein